VSGLACCEATNLSATGEAGEEKGVGQCAGTDGAVTLRRKTETENDQKQDREKAKTIPNNHILDS
jgi:hypothetical protein